MIITVIYIYIYISFKVVGSTLRKHLIEIFSSWDATRLQRYHCNLKSMEVFQGGARTRDVHSPPYDTPTSVPSLCTFL